MLSRYLLSLGKWRSWYCVRYYRWYKHEGNDPHLITLLKHQSKRHVIHITKEKYQQRKPDRKRNIKIGKFLKRFYQKAAYDTRFCLFKVSFFYSYFVSVSDLKPSNGLSLSLRHSFPLVHFVLKNTVTAGPITETVLTKEIPESSKTRIQFILYLSW